MERRALIHTLLVAIVVLAHVPRAAAGPFCGRTVSFAPEAESTLPIAPSIALFVEDFYYSGKRRAIAMPPRVRATLEGKPVRISTRDVRTVDGVIRYVAIKSRGEGKLEVFVEDLYSKELVLGPTYTITRAWQVPAKPAVTLARGADSRLAPYRHLGHLALLRVDVPAIGFSLRWRRSQADAWRARPLPALIEAGEVTRTEARLGQTMCGMVENVPMAALEAGIEVELTARLPDGRDVKIIDGLPTPVVIPPGSAPR